MKELSDEYSLPDRVERLLEVIKACSSDYSAVQCCEELSDETKELQGCGVTTSKARLER